MHFSNSSDFIESTYLFSFVPLLHVVVYKLTACSIGYIMYSISSCYGVLQAPIVGAFLCGGVAQLVRAAES